MSTPPLPLPEHVLLTAIGRDRPGLVGALAGWVFELGGNIEDSRMALLGGEFAILMLAEGPPGFLGRIEANRAAFEGKHSLAVAVRPAQGERSASSEPVLRYALTATCLDHPGVVFRVSELLRQHNVNIVMAETRTESAPFTGTPIFRLEMEMEIPASTPGARLRRELETLGLERNIDFDLRAL